MRAKRTIQLRRCTLCNKTGHNKAKCSLNSLNNKAEKSATQTQKKELFFTEKSVAKPGEMICVNNKIARRSPHVIDLKQAKENAWHDVLGYQAEKHIKEERRVVDFGEMIRIHRLTNADLPAQAGSTDVVKKMDTKNVLNKQKLNRNYTEIKRKLNIEQILIKCFTNIKCLILNIGERVKNNLRIFGSLDLKFNFRKFAFSTIVLLLLISLPFPAFGYYRKVKDTSARVVEASTNAFLSLQSSTVAALHANIDQAQFDLNSALVSFGEANNIVEKDYRVLQYVAGLLPVIGTEVTSRQHLLVAGQNLALGNTYLVKGIKEAGEASTTPITDRLAVIANHLQSAIPQYQEALENLSVVDVKIIPTEYQQSFQDFKLLFTAFILDMKNLTELSHSLNLVFGSEQLKRYLIVFQNNDELRPTGGFMGSFAILDVQKGKIINLDIPAGGTYDLQGQLNISVKPPLPLQIANQRWEFQDANWFPDFPASAQKMVWFYEQSRNATIDGVIAVNASVLERLLKVLGPVESIEHGVALDANNALASLQYKVEKDYDREKNQPKAVLGDLAGQFLNRLNDLQTVSAIGLLTELHEALGQKEIQVYLSDKDLENKLSAFGWTGEIINTTLYQDYLMVVNTNIQGEKSDAKIEQSIEHQAVVNDDGSITDTVVITRQHHGQPGEMFYGANNVDFLRVYVPQGAELLDAGGFIYPPESAFKAPESWYQDDVDLTAQEKEVGIDSKTGTRITEEFGKTVYGNWTMTAPGEVSKVYFTYKLPFKAFVNGQTIINYANWNKWKELIMGKENTLSNYSLLAQKQSGLNSSFSTRIIYPDNWLPLWKENNDLQLAENGAEFFAQLDTDKVLGVVMERK